MKSVTFFLLFISLFLFNLTLAHPARLTIGDPRQSWYTYPGSIEDMQITVKPHGAYFEIGMFLKISPVGSIFKSEKDTLEAVLDFGPGTYSFINDSWLFINDSVYIRAKLLDKYTAGMIYEGIVKRRKDPSIVYKLGQGTYQVRIFPMIGNSSRTIKINYFVTAEWYGNYAKLKLPLSLLNLSSKKPAGAKIYLYPDSLFTNPGFGGVLSVPFKDIKHPVFGNVREGFIAFNDIKNDYLYYNHKSTGGVFAHLSDNEKGKFYQVVINPTVLNSFVMPRKVAYLLDYNQNYSYYLKADLFKAVKESIYKNLLKTDSFNIFLSNDNILRLGKKWIPADTTNVEYYFGKLSAAKLRDSTNLENLLYSAIEWVNSNSDSADILLVANTAYKGGSDFFNNILNKSMALISNKIRISIVSYDWYSNIVNNIGGNSYYGNNYLYTTLAAHTKGYFYNDNYYYGSQSLVQMVNSVMTNLLGGYEKLSAYISFKNGFAFDRVTINDNNIGSFNNNTNYMEFGKYEGLGPMSIELSGYFRKQPFFKKIEVNNTNQTLNYDNKSMWAAGYLINRETSNNSNSINIYDIINTSLEHRILSLYTAFLATDNDKPDTLNNNDDNDDDNDDDDDNNIPVELIYFDGKSRDGGIDLLWATASEINNYGFQIDKRILNETKWNEVSFIEGNGNSRNVSYYHYRDSDVIPRTTYQYRLRQIDLDGTVNNAGGDYSQKNEVIVTVRYDAEFNLALAQNIPNPMNNFTRISFTLPSAMQTRIEILDITGKIAAILVDGELTGGEHEIIWQGKNSDSELLPAGTYLCRLTAGTETRIVKINIIR